MRQLVGELREVDIMKGQEWSDKAMIEPYQADARYMMGKSPVAAKDIDEGQPISVEDIAYISPAKGVSPAVVDSLIGKPLRKKL